MKQNTQLYDTLKNIFGKDENVFPMIVKRVDKSRALVDGEFDGLEIGGIRLQATSNEDAKGLKLYPAIDSVVLVQKLGDKGEMFVLMTSEIEELNLSIGSTILDVTEDGIVFNGGLLGGLLKLDATVDRLNKIETDLNNLKTVFGSWIPVPSDGGAALKSVISSWFATPLTPTTNADVENENVKQ